MFSLSRKVKALGVAGLTAALPLLSMGAAVVISGASITFDSSSVANVGGGALQAVGGFMENRQNFVMYILAISWGIYGLKWIHGKLTKKGGGGRR